MPEGVTTLPADVHAFIPMLLPVQRAEPVYPEQARTQKTQGVVQLLVTIDATGAVTKVEVLTGPQIFHEAAVEAMKRWRFQPVLRNGHRVAAMTNESLIFTTPGQRLTHEDMGDPSEQRAASRRVFELTQRFVRSPEQVLADLENSLTGASTSERAFWSRDLAKAAVRAGDLTKAVSYAHEALDSGASPHAGPKDGALAHDGNMVLGLIALRRGEVDTAKQYLLTAGQTNGGPSLNSFGPNMMLAQALLDANENDTVLRYFDECRTFWKGGTKKLADWSAIVRGGGKPDFGANLLY